MPKRKILVEVPDWASERRVYIFLGRECYILGEPDGTFWIKKVRCNFCGKCCMGVKPEFSFGTKEIDGKICCKHLSYDKIEKKWFCRGNGLVPFSCEKDAIQQPPHPECVIKYEKMAI